MSHNLNGYAFDLYIHLEGSYSLFITGYFEVHVAKGIFYSSNTLPRRARDAVSHAMGADTSLSKVDLEARAEYDESIVNPWEAAGRGYVDAVIEPSATRAQITTALRALRTKRAALPVPAVLGWKKASVPG